MSLEFILQLADSTCHNRLPCRLIDRDSDSFLSTPWTYEDGWKLLLHDTYYTTSSTTQNTLSSYLSKLQNVPHSIFTFARGFSSSSLSDGYITPLVSTSPRHSDDRGMAEIGQKNR